MNHVDSGNILFEDEEQKILLRVGELKRMQANSNRIKESLIAMAKSVREDVEVYKKLREKQQRSIWKEKNLGWCQKCESFYPSAEIELLYTEGIEEQGHGHSEYDIFLRRIRSLCKKCVADIFSCPRGGDDKFQCYQTERSGLDFVIFKSGEWLKIDNLERVIVMIEKMNISEKEFKVGKNFEFLDYPNLSFKIDRIEVLKKSSVASSLSSRVAGGKEEK